MLIPVVGREDVVKASVVGGGVRVAVSRSDVPKEWARETLRAASCTIGPVAAKEIDVVVQWLDCGAKDVVLQGSLEEIVEVADGLPKERLGAYFSWNQLQALSKDQVNTVLDSVATVLVDPQVDSLQAVEARCGELTNLLGKGRFSIHFNAHLSSVGTKAERSDLVGKLHHLNGSDNAIHVDCASAGLPTGNGEPSDGPGFCIGLSLVSCLKTDRPDGLYSTVVCDEFGVALGLVYSCKESFMASLACGRGVYWSRSRNQLWRKGDTSGAYQELVCIDFDCDADAARFRVRQLGTPPSFCHQGHRTCWGADSGFFPLFRTLTSRKENAPVGSYTKRLFEDKKLLRNKLLEEAQEVIEAVEEEDKVHVAEEVADLMYFLLTACVSGQADLEAVGAVLDARSLKVKRRPGNAKEHRIQAAEQTLAALNKDVSK